MSNSNDIYNVECDGDEYSLIAIPEENKPIIGTMKESLLQSLSVKSIDNDLNKAGQLLYIAYAALGGTEVQAQVSRLQTDLLVAADDSISTIQIFADSSKQIADYIVQSYKWLLKGHESIAINKLQHCADCAKIMESKAENLQN